MTGSVRIDLPWGLGYFSRDVRIKRYVHIEGRGGGADPNAGGSGFKLAPLAKIIFDDVNSSGDGGSAATSYLGHFAIQAKAPAVGTQAQGLTYNILGISAGAGDVWTAGFTELGTLVVYSGAAAGANPTQPGSGPDVAFRCTVAGIAAGGEPGGFSGAGIAQIGTPYTDGGGVEWTVESLPKDRQNSTAYVVGQRITNPGDTRFIFECAVAGTSDVSVPADFIQPWFQSPITDGTVTWNVIPACNIFVQTTNVKIEHGQIRGGWGPAVYFESGGSGPTTVYADFPRVDHLDVFYAGGGVHLHGQDVGGGQISHVNFNGTDTVWRTDAGTAPGLGTGEICIWDRAESGNAMIANYAQFAAAPGFVSDSAGGSPGPGQASASGSLSNWYNNLNECRPTWLGGGSWWGTDAAGFSYVGGTVFAVRPACQNIVCTDTTTATHLQAGLTINDGHSVFPFSTAVEQANGTFFAWSYNLASAFFDAIYDAGTSGWFALSTGQANNHTRCVGMSGMAAIEGPAHWREYLGKFVGADQDGALQYRGVSTAALTANVINGGQRNVGDKFAVQSSGTAGTWEEYVVSAAGYRGLPWVMGTATQGIPAVGVPASMVEPTANGATPAPGLQVFRCAGGPVMGGQSGGAATISSFLATTYTGYSVTLTGLSGMSSADIGRFLVISGAASPENNGAFAITDYDVLSVGTSVVIYNPQLPNASDANNGAIAWQELDVITSTGVTEPNWAPAVAVGDLIADSGITWMLLGFTPTYVRGQFIDDPVTALTPQTRKQWSDTSATDSGTAAPNAKVDSYRRSLQTTTNATQVLLTTEALSDDSVSVVDVIVTGKQNGNHSEFVSAKLSVTFGRNNGAGPVDVGVDDLDVKGTASLAASTFDLFLNGNAIDVRCTPGVNAPVDWGVFVHVSEGRS
jgi:hypothetical protein